MCRVGTSVCIVHYNLAMLIHNSVIEHVHVHVHVFQGHREYEQALLYVNKTSPYSTVITQ